MVEEFGYFFVFVFVVGDFFGWVVIECCFEILFMKFGEEGGRIGEEVVVLGVVCLVGGIGFNDFFFFD